MDSILIEYLQSGKAWLLVGSGPSTDAGYPSWQRLALEVINTIKIENTGADLSALNTAYSKNDYPRVFEDAVKMLSEERLLQVIREKLQPIRQSKIYETIARWPVSVYLTTNYDNEIQKSLATLGEAYNQYSNSEENFGLLVPGQTNAIFKLHGDLTSWDNVILTSSQYKAIDTGDEWLYWRTKMTSVCQMNPLVVIGHSLTDVNIKHVLKAAKNGAGVTQPVCWIAPDVPEKDRIKYLKDYRIRVVSYPNRDGNHKNLVRLIESISNFIPPRLSVKASRKIAEVSHSPLGDNSAAPGFFVYNAFSTQTDFEEKRTQIILNAFQSALPEIDGKGAFSIEEALSILGWPSELKISDDFLSKVIEKTIENEIFIVDGDKFRVHPTGLDSAQKQRTSFTHSQNSFRQSLVLRIKREFSELDERQIERISTDIVLALVGFFKEGGLTLASLIVNRNTKSVLPKSIVPFITLASTQYDNLTMRLAFFKTSTEIFRNPETAEHQFLGKISQGFFAFHILGVFGDAAIERLNNAKNTVWLLDSDAQIHALALGSETNWLFRTCFTELHKLGVRLFTVKSLCSETETHLRYANRVVSEYGPNSEYIYAAANGETPFRKGNSFLAGFIKWQDAGNPCNWQSYLYQIFHQNKFQDIDVADTLNQLGIEVIEMADWPGFIDEHYADVEEYTKMIAHIWESENPEDEMENNNSDDDDTEEESYLTTDPYTKAKPEADAFSIVKKERDGTYYIISDENVSSPAWFISHTSIINLIDENTRITWVPEAFVRFASTLCSVVDPPTAEHAFSILLIGLAQSGISFVDEGTIERVFGGIIDQTKLSIDEIRDGYKDNLEKKYGEPAEKVLERIRPSNKPTALVQLASEIAQRESSRRKSAEQIALQALREKDEAKKELRQLDSYRRKLTKRTSRAKQKASKRKKKRK